MMSGERVLVSVVIPVHNAEKFLRYCLDSIIQQSLKDIEIILMKNPNPPAMLGRI